VPTPQFIVELRRKVGHDLLWLPGVTAVVVDARGRVLLVRRADNARWTLIYGCLDPGEQPAVGAAREVQEETGVTVKVVRALRIEALNATAYPNGDRVQFLDICLLCAPVEGDARVNDDESIDVRWFDVDAMPAVSARDSACIASALSGTVETWFDDPI
jgi:8-oxo-dGTP pyrophosphatase MutT (NUDIX family)